MVWRNVRATEQCSVAERHRHRKGWSVRYSRVYTTTTVNTLCIPRSSESTRTQKTRHQRSTSSAQVPTSRRACHTGIPLDVAADVVAVSCCAYMERTVVSFTRNAVVPFMRPAHGQCHVPVATGSIFTEGIYKVQQIWRRQMVAAYELAHPRVEYKRPRVFCRSLPRRIR